MAKNKIRSVIIHSVAEAEPYSRLSQVSYFHAEAIERHLKQSGLPPEQQIIVVEKILAFLHTDKSAVI